MKKVTLHDRYLNNVTCKLLVEPLNLDDPCIYCNYYARLTVSQIKKVRRMLPNGCKSYSEIRQGSSGCVAAEIYFNL